MAYRGFSGGGFVGNHLTAALLEALRPAADNAGRHATVGDPSTTAAPYISDGESWKAAVLLSADGLSLAAGGAAVLQTVTDIIDPRDWTGFDATGNNDNSTILQAAIDEAGYKSRADYGFGQSLRLQLPPGRIVFSTPLELKQNLWMEGIFGADGGTELRWTGADGADAIINPAGMSFCYLSNFRLKDFRTTPTSGRGISLLQAVNGISLRRLMVMNFPLEQIYIGADSGHSCDCTELFDIWATSTVATAKGILLERADNNIIIDNIKSDLATTPANDGYVIRVQNVQNDNAVIGISNVKHESNNRCPTLSFPQTTRGNLSIRSINQRNPTGGAAGAGDIVQFGAAAGASAYYYDNTSSGITTGSGSEVGGRVTLENIAGTNHSDWTGATGAATIRGLGTGAVVFGSVQRAILGNNGRIVRHFSANSIPNGVQYGNVGDTFTRADGTSTTSSFWFKQQGAATNTGWAPLSYELQSPAFAASLSVNLQAGNRVAVGALTGNITHNSPTNVPLVGMEVAYEFTQDGTGGRTITWSSLHKGAWPTGSGTAAQKKRVFGVSDGTNIVFAGDSGWY